MFTLLMSVLYFSDWLRQQNQENFAPQNVYESLQQILMSLNKTGVPGTKN